MMNLARLMTNCSMTTRNGRYLRLAALAAVAAAPAAALAQVAPAPVPAPVQAAPAPTLQQIPGVTVRYYNVTGNSIPLLRESIAAQRPKDPVTGQPQAASAHWSIGTGVRKQTTGTACKIVAATPTFKAEVVMPRLVTPEGVVVPAPVMAEWQRYVASLEQQQAAILHQVHSRLGEVQTAVMGSTCEGAAAAANAAIARITPAPAAAPAAVPAPARAPAPRKRGG
ncbi:MAG TPA: DUF922 domain-containing protein [Allosphingosinicella sp.]|nr:DUF922 domain-containing protein [Allosphingosinicella sp.]